MINFTIFLSSLGSGSSGNAFVLESADEAIIVDQGFSRKELLSRMAALKLDPGKLRGALLTHEHSDHAKGSRVFCDALNLPLFTAARTALYLERKHQLPKLSRVFEPGERFQIGNFDITSFPLAHDAVDPVGFSIRFGGVKVGIATDLGLVGEPVRRELSGSTALVLESNYDRTMLMNSNRTLELKRRIFGVRGHLDNRDACALLGELLSDQTELLLLAHVSRECNDPELLKHVCAERLCELHRDHLHFEVLRQDEPSEKFVLRGGGLL